MSKIAFLALTYEGFEQSQLMNRFFLKSGRIDFSLYIHACSQPKSWEKFFCVTPIPQTGWGRFAIVQATNRLLKTALEDKENSHFILTSGSHFPLYKIGVAIDHIKNLDQDSIYFTDEFFIYPSNRIKLLKSLKDSNKHPFNICSFRPVSQWWVCGRSAAEKIVEASELESLFDDKVISGADEIYYKAVADLLSIPQQKRSFCYVEWGRKKGPCNHPRTFDVVDKNLLNKIRNDEDFLFLRKVNHKTKIRLNIENF